MRHSAVLLVLALPFFAPATLVTAAAAPSGSYAAEYGRIAGDKGRVPDAERLRRLLDAYWRYQMDEYPEFATYVGLPGRNDRWTDQSLAAIARRKRELSDPLEALGTIDRGGLDGAARLDYDLFRHALEDAIEGNRFPSELMPMTQLGGPQQDVAQVLALAPTGAAADYRDRIARLDRLPALIDQVMALLQAGAKARVTPARITLRDVADQIRGQIPDDATASPLLRPFAEMPASIPPEDQAALRREATQVYAAKVVPAYRKLLDFFVASYLPRTLEAIGMDALPDGAAWYAYNARIHTTTRLTPREIHDIGLREVKRIRAEMDQVMARTGFKGTFAEFTAFLRQDARFYFAQADDLVRAYRDISKRADPGLIKLFGRLPRLPYGVTPVPAHAEKSQTTAYYLPGSAESARPGMYYVNTYDLKSRPKWEMEALTLHEAVPGHHLQVALAQEMEGVPEFRKHAGYTAYVEGWALYAESLGPELGMYEDPYSKFGQLTYEMWRAIRLVVDTGLHSMDWSRERAIALFRDNSAKTEHDIVVEVDRYIVMPGQALAYKIGELKIKELRAAAAAELGDRFDLRAFHDLVLAGGALPLDVLEARVRAWVAERKSGPRR